MARSSFLSRPVTIIAILLLQIIPIILFPTYVFTPTSQVWWLPAILVICVLVADFQLIVRRSASVNPWLLIGFAQGFNVISRLMMVWPNATVTTEAGTAVNWIYVVLTIISIVASWWLLIYTEKPEIREGLLRA
ncbi:MAG: hypothetical protein MUC34_18950 [Anaerolineae bacterium]|jgi:hypothetical protein|nr:hypothetical protein [Anaerolineae bacterium]